MNNGVLTLRAFWNICWALDHFPGRIKEPVTLYGRVVMIYRLPVWVRARDFVLGARQGLPIAAPANSGEC